MRSKRLFGSHSLKIALYAALFLCTAPVLQATDYGTQFTIPYTAESPDGSIGASYRTFNTKYGGGGRRFFDGIPLTQIDGYSDSFFGIASGDLIWHIGFSDELQPAPRNGIPVQDRFVGVTRDQMSLRIVVATDGDNPGLYQLSLRNSLNKSSEWSLLASLGNESLTSLTFSPYHNAFFGLRKYVGSLTEQAILIKFGLDGKKIEEIPLPPFPVRIGRGYYHSHLIAPFASRLVLLVEPPSDALVQPTDLSRIYLIDPSKGLVELTYEALTQVPPTIKFIEPLQGKVFRLGERIRCEVEISDRNNNLSEARIFDDAGGSHWVEFIPSQQTSPHRWGYSTSFMTPGRHTITAQTRDSAYKADATLQIIVRDTLSAKRTPGGAISIHAIAIGGERFAIEFADSLDTSTWNELIQITGSGEEIEVATIQPSSPCKYFRLRPVDR